jgi:acetolactate synthase-1/2/3 large subunit
MGEVIAWLNKRLPDDAIVTNGAGNYAPSCTASSSIAASRPSSRPTSGAMGYGVPAAVAAKIAEPDRMVCRWRATAAS